MLETAICFVVVTCQLESVGWQWSKASWSCFDHSVAYCLSTGLTLLMKRLADKPDYRAAV
jgi:hypothetical protein